MLRLLLALALLLAAPARAQDDGGAFAIAGIEVDIAAKTAAAARQGGWREAQRKAWPQLWSRLTGAPAANAPRLGDDALDGIVSGIEIERERMGPRRYIARLGVVFDRSRASRYLGQTARMLRSSPMLLLPVLIDGGTRTLYERRTPWLAAWARFREGATPIDYVRAPGSAGDAVLLTAHQAYRPNRALWRSLLTRYQTADVLTAEARLTRAYPGGPVSGRFRALHGPDARELARFTLSVGTTAELPAMLDSAVRRIDAAYTQALRAGRLRAEEDLLVELEPIVSEAPRIAFATRSNAIEAAIATPDAATLAQFESAIGVTPGVSGVAMTGVALGGVSRIRIDFATDFEMLRYRLDQGGLRLENAGAGLQVRQRAAGEAPLPRPPTPEERAAAQAAAAAALALAAERDAAGATGATGATPAPATAAPAPIASPEAPEPDPAPQATPPPPPPPA